MGIEYRDVQKRVADNVKYARTTRGLTMDRLAELTGMSKGYISLVESGQRNPSLKQLVIIANVCDIRDMDYFFNERSIDAF